MKILYLQTFPLWGSGSGTYARFLASEAGRKHKVGIVAPDTRVPVRTKVYPIKMPLKVAFTGHPEWPVCKLYKDITSRELFSLYNSFFRTTIKAVEDFKPDIIHVHHLYPLSWVARYIKATYGVPYVITCHGSELPTAQKDRRYWGLTVDSLRKSARIVPNSQWTREWMLKIFGEEFASLSRVIPGGVDVSKFKYDESLKKSINEKYGLKGKKVVLFSGKLTPYKGVKYLVKAAKKIHGEVLILGDGPERQNLENLARELGVTNVHFLGYVGDTGQKLFVNFYSRADVVVVPSVWDEPLGLVVLEAMACSTPVVTTRKGGIPLAVKDGVNGYFVRPRNATEIAEKVNKILDNEKLMLRLGENARRITEEIFSWPRISHRFELMYKRFGVKRGNSYWDHLKKKRKLALQAKQNHEHNNQVNK